MSFLAQIQTATPTNFYAEQAINNTAVINGACPNYYDHYRMELDNGFYQFYKPTRDKDAEPLKPFSPTNVFNLKDTNGNHIMHTFVAVEAMPIGYFIGAKLSNYGHELPVERKVVPSPILRSALTV